MIFCVIFLTKTRYSEKFDFFGSIIYCAIFKLLVIYCKFSNCSGFLVFGNIEVFVVGVLHYWCFVIFLRKAASCFRL